MTALDRSSSDPTNRPPDGGDVLIDLEPEPEESAEEHLVADGPHDGHDGDGDDRPGTGGSTPGPERRTAARSRDVVVRLLVAGAVATVLSSQHLVDVAQRMPFGRTRTVSLAAATTLDDAVGAVHLDEPDRWLRLATGRPLPADADQPDENLLTSRSLSADDLPATLPPVATSSTVAPSTTAAPAPGGGPDSTTAPSTTAPPETTTTTAPVPPPRPVDPSNKLRVWAGGDSLGEYIGARLLHPLSDQQLAQVELDYHISTGLTRPDYFDWQQQLWDIMHREQPPEALVFMVGGNDNQGMLVDGSVATLGSDAWRDEYARRASFVMDMASIGGGHLYWVGLPPMRDAERHEVARTVNAVLAEEAAVRPWVTFVDIEQQFVGPDGNYSTNLPDPATGDQKVARADDGVHITLTGSTWIAEGVWAAIDDLWALSPEGPSTDLDDAPSPSDGPDSAHAATDPTGAGSGN